MGRRNAYPNPFFKDYPAFYIGDRYFGIITASVAGKAAGQYQFTSALPVTVLKLLAPQINARASRDVLARLAKEPLMEPR